jgi:hypothetical protein
MLPTIQAFSAGYDIGEFLVIPSDQRNPRINARLYAELRRRATENLPTGEAPIYFRYPAEREHFSVYPDNNVRVDSLELPPELVALYPFKRLPAVEAFLVAHPVGDEQLSWLSQVDIAPAPDEE